MKQIVFIITLLVTLGVFSFTAFRIYRFFKLTKPYPIKDWGKRIMVFLSLVIGQTRIFRRPVVGLMHAFVFWGFCLILFGSIEMVVDGITGSERTFSLLGVVYNFIIASGDVGAFIIFFCIAAFLFRRIFMNIKRFTGTEMGHKSHLDAAVALLLIFFLMVSLLGANTFYILLDPLHYQGAFPVSKILAGLFSGVPKSTIELCYESFWWTHILLIFIFANILPYSKHFHVFLSVPNVFLSRLEPLGKMGNMDNVTKEVKIMMNPDLAYATPTGAEAPPERFGVKDVEDITWKNYLDALSCTQCGRCTSVCPANTTGKILSPRKVMMDVRARMKEKGPSLVKKGKDYDDSKSLIRNYVSVEELWACTMCNACARECPIKINHPSMIADMRRYLVMEESAAPSELNAIFNNIQNNGAPWQYPSEDRILWTKSLALGKEAKEINVPIMKDVFASGEKPEYLFWVGCSGAFDDRYKKVARAFTKILVHLNVSFAVLGKEETCTGDPARRAGNEMLYQMQAFSNIEVFSMYGVKKILTICPHCYNIFKNDYPDLGGNYEVLHYTQFLEQILEGKNIKTDVGVYADKKVTFHDPCYLGRVNDEYGAPRKLLNYAGIRTLEMKRNHSFSFCCGAGGGQMFKEEEKGDKKIFIERTEEALSTGADIIATSCPFCMTMITDGLKYKNKEEEISNLDIAEMLALSMGL